MSTDRPRAKHLAGSSTAAWMLVFFLVGLFGSYVYFDWKSGRRPGPTDLPGSGQSIRGDGAGATPIRSGGNDGLVADAIGASQQSAIVTAAESAAASVVSVIAYVPTGQPAPVRSRLYGNAVRDPIFGRAVEPNTASGFIVDESGIILTNEHVIRDAAQLQVVLDDGRLLTAELAGSDVGYDLAVLKVESDEPLPPVKIGDPSILKVGEWAIAIGNPFGLIYNDTQNTVTVGVISALHRDVNYVAATPEANAVYKDMIQTDAAINPGNSGGPLLNQHGEVVGINTFILSSGGGSVGIGFAMPIDTAVRVAREIIQYGEVQEIVTGIRVVEINPVLAAKLRIRDMRGLFVHVIESGSPGERAGIQAYDIIRKIEDQQVSSRHEASRILFGTQPGQVLTFTVERDGEILEIPVRAQRKVKDSTDGSRDAEGIEP